MARSFDNEEEDRSMKQRSIAIFTAILSLCGVTRAQDARGKDSTIIFQPVDQNIVSQTSYSPLLNAWGLDLLMSNNGFGGGFFLRHEYSDEIAGFVGLALSDVKDAGEIEYYNYWTGQSYVPNKINRLIYIPLVAGVQYRLWKDDIVDNFRPFLTAGVGPSLIFVAPYSRLQLVSDPLSNLQGMQYVPIDFFSSLKYGQWRYTFGGYVGAGIYFGLDKGSLSGVNVRYYFSPYPAGIQVMTNSVLKNFGGLYLSLTFGSLY